MNAGVTSSFLLLVVRPGALVASLLLVVASSFLFPVKNWVQTRFKATHNQLRRGVQLPSGVQQELYHGIRHNVILD